MKNWTTLPKPAVITKIVKNLTERNFTPIVVANKSEALEKLKTLIPEGSEVMTGSSTTLLQIGFMDYLQSPDSPWKNIQAKVWSENDEAIRNTKRREATTSQYFLASANAITEDGQLVAADATGSRIGAFHFAAEHLILVVSTKKIVPTLEDAMNRIRDHVFPLENERAQQAYGMGSSINKWVILEREVVTNRVTVILVQEDLGF